MEFRRFIIHTHNFFYVLVSRDDALFFHFFPFNRETVVGDEADDEEFQNKQLGF